MKLYSENKYYKLYQGSMLDMQEVIKPESIDSVVTDPPYELNFMNKGWDNSGVAFQSNTWKQCYDVLKPGGYLLAFGGSRTYHRIACAIEDAGFEIRDTIMWLYGSGFPKSMNIGLAIDKKNGVDNRTGNMKTDGGVGGGVRCFSDDNYEWKRVYDERIAQNKWRGWGTCLKPSFEPIIVARKPFKTSLLDNIIEYGVGGINIEECRVGNEERINKEHGYSNIMIGGCFEKGTKENKEYVVNGRFPANTILTYDDTDFDEVCGGFPDTKSNKTKHNDNRENKGNSMFIDGVHNENNSYQDSGNACRFFYCAKASKKDRNEGCDDLKDTYSAVSNQAQAEFKRGNDNFADNNNSTYNKVYIGKNTHPTIKPTELMQYLIRLVSPNGATILDCFNGSGSTGKAVMYENKERNKNYKYIGIELTEEYLPISKARIEYAINGNLKVEKEKKQETPEGQTTIFDFIKKGDGKND